MDKRLQRDIAGRFATGVTVITFLNQQGKPVGMTANSFTSLSLEPPLLLFCIDKSASLYDDMMKTEAFAVNILSKEQEALSRQFSKKEIDRFAGVKYSTGMLGTPILEGILAHFECKTYKFYEGGDHMIVIGEIVNGHYRDGEPLLFYCGKYKSLV